MSKLVPIKKFTVVQIGEYGNPIRTARQAAIEYAYQVTNAIRRAHYENMDNTYITRSGFIMVRDSRLGMYVKHGRDPVYERAYRRSLAVFKKYLQ